MYWNINIADDADYTIRLTLTWDVLKYKHLPQFNSIYSD